MCDHWPSGMYLYSTQVISRMPIHHSCVDICGLNMSSTIVCHCLCSDFCQLKNIFILSCSLNSPNSNMIQVSKRELINCNWSLTWDDISVLVSTMCISGTCKFSLKAPSLGLLYKLGWLWAWKSIRWIVFEPLPAMLWSLPPCRLCVHPPSYYTNRITRSTIVEKMMLNTILRNVKSGLC